MIIADMRYALRYAAAALMMPSPLLRQLYCRYADIRLLRRLPRRHYFAAITLYRYTPCCAMMLPLFHCHTPMADIFDAAMLL